MMFYIYGEVQKAVGSGIILRDMTVIQALAQGGGLDAARHGAQYRNCAAAHPVGKWKSAIRKMSDRILPSTTWCTCMRVCSSPIAGSGSRSCLRSCYMPDARHLN